VLLSGFPPAQPESSCCMSASAQPAGAVLLTYVKTGGFSHATMMAGHGVTPMAPTTLLRCSVPQAVGLSLPNLRARLRTEARVVWQARVCRPATLYVGPLARLMLAREISVDCVSYKDGDAKQPHDYRDCFNHLTRSYY
jgi:hypothetical protein